MRVYKITETDNDNIRIINNNRFDNIQLVVCSDDVGDIIIYDDLVTATYNDWFVALSPIDSGRILDR